MSTYGLSILGPDLDSLATTAKAADQAGFDTAWASEFYSRSGSISMRPSPTAQSTVGSGPRFSTAWGEASWCWPPRHAISTNYRTAA